MVIKSDNEPSIVQVVQATIGALKMAGVTSVTEENSVPYDPQTNGAAENAVKLLKGTMKTLLLGLERQIGARVPIDHPIVGWIVSHAAHVRTMRSRGVDGKTAHQRVKGSSSVVRLIICRYKARAQEGALEDLPGD